MSKTLEVAAVARVNGVALHAPGETIAPEILRQRACMELLRQAAQREGLLAGDDPAGTDGAVSEAASVAIDALLERALRVPEPADDDCRRHFAARAQAFGRGERVRLRHILFAVTPGVDVVALRKRAEAALLDVRCRDRSADDGFAATARTLSNCPSGADGGDLGWLVRDDCAPEYAQEIFAKSEVGVLPRLVHSRFGLHVVEVLQREPGVVPEFEAVRAAVRADMQRHGFVTALRQYLSVLAGAAQIEGVDIDGAETPLVQ
ncbi:MAG: peptidylprolyl isomerase [Burkholderiales bacterium]